MNFKKQSLLIFFWGVGVYQRIYYLKGFWVCFFLKKIVLLLFYRRGAAE